MIALIRGTTLAFSFAAAVMAQAALAEEPGLDLGDVLDTDGDGNLQEYADVPETPVDPNVVIMSQDLNTGKGNSDNVEERCGKQKVKIISKDFWGGAGTFSIEKLPNGGAFAYGPVVTLRNNPTHSDHSCPKKKTVVGIVKKMLPF